MQNIFFWLWTFTAVSGFPTNITENDTDPISFDYPLYSEESEDEFYMSIYDSIRDSNPEILTAVERRYKSHKQHHHEDLTPLLSLVTQEPHSMTIMLVPSKMEPQSQIRLLYERVPAHRLPNRTHLDHPVMDFVPIIRNSQTYVINDLPRGGTFLSNNSTLCCYSNSNTKQNYQNFQENTSSVVRL